MSIIVNELDRQVIPRWRAFHVATSSNQLASLNNNIQFLDREEILLKKNHDWQSNKDIAHAVDLLATACLTEQSNEYLEVIKFLKINAPENKLLSDLIVSITEPEKLLQSKLNYYSHQDLFRYASIISKQKRRLSETPRDPIGWADLAYFYTILGEKIKAERSMSNALYLAPNNRFVLRSAVRMFIHHDDTARALDTIRKASSLKYDPWLISAEIATAQANSKTSKNIKIGIKIIEDKKFSFWHISELASAVATTELSFGKHKKAKKLFDQSLVDPTENSVAQVEWAHRKDKKILLPLNKLDLQNTFEANALLCYQKKDWIGTVNSTEKWQNDQPFSSRPAVLGSYVAAICMNDFKLSKNFASYGLRCNQENKILLNNLIFAEIQLGNYSSAQEKLDSIIEINLNPADKQMILATKGLLDYRIGNITSGRERYKRSIELAKEVNSRFKLFLVTYYYLLEEAKLNVFNPEENIKDLLLVAKDHQDPSIDYLVGNLKETFKISKK
ncbi:MAG: hypothetical protein GXP19_08690 [Gammaproteobacteria bacterium]|nr:hypothetical protein [Gammaproteobacteria bacterium]